MSNRIRKKKDSSSGRWAERRRYRRQVWNKEANYICTAAAGGNKSEEGIELEFLTQQKKCQLYLCIPPPPKKKEKNNRNI